MKKIIASLFLAVLLLILVACGGPSAVPQEPEMTTQDAIAGFLASNDLTGLTYLVDNKDNYTKLTGDEIRGQMSYEWAEQKRVYKVKDDVLASVYTYSGVIKLNRDGTGETRSPGNEPLSWAIDGDYLYFKTASDGTAVQVGDTKYQYEVREVYNDGTVFGTVYGLYGSENNTLILLIHPDSELAK